MSSLTDPNPILSFLGDKKYTVHRHILLQLFILLITSSVLFDDAGELVLSSHRLITLLGYSFIINLIVYTNVYLLVPRYLFTGKLLKYVLFAFLLLAFSSLLIALFEAFFSTRIRLLQRLI